jgi:hypothetical protein
LDTGVGQGAQERCGTIGNMASTRVAAPVNARDEAGVRRVLLLLLLSCGRSEVVSPAVAVASSAPPVTAPVRPVSCRDTTPPSCERCGSLPVVLCGAPPPTCATGEQPEVVFCDAGMCPECSPHLSGRCVPCVP